MGRTKIRKTECTQEVCYNAQFLHFFFSASESRMLEKIFLNGGIPLISKSLLWPATDRNHQRHEGQSQFFDQRHTDAMRDTKDKVSAFASFRQNYWETGRTQEGQGSMPGKETGTADRKAESCRSAEPAECSPQGQRKTKWLLLGLLPLIFSTIVILSL